MFTSFKIQIHKKLVPVFDSWPAGQRSHSQTSPTRCLCGGHDGGGAFVVGRYHGRQIQKISSNSYLYSLIVSHTHLLFTFFDPSGHFVLSTTMHSSCAGSYTLPSLQRHAGNWPLLPSYCLFFPRQKVSNFSWSVHWIHVFFVEKTPQGCIHYLCTFWTL